MKFSLQKQRGISLIEVLIGSAIIVTGILALSESYSRYIKFAFANEGTIQAAYLSEETIEAVTSIRDRGWNANIKSLATSTTYYLAWDSTQSYWKATTTPQYVDSIFLRQFSLVDVKRDTNDKISTSGTYDPNTKQIAVTISYFQGHGTTTQQLSTYITNLNSD